MRSFRYQTTGNWYKGNTHIHTDASDGGLSREEVAQLYGARGYDFLFCTDHWCVSEVGGREEHGVLWMDGVEFDGMDYADSYYHVVCLGARVDVKKEAGLVPALEEAREKGGIVILAHPFWTGNSLEDTRRLGFDAVEVYNHLCHWLNGKGSSLVHWNALLELHPNTFCTAADDSHLWPGNIEIDGGWIAVNAAELSQKAVLQAMRKGNYYSSQGPEFRSLEMSDTTLRVSCSEIRYARLVGPGSHGFRKLAENDENLLTSFLFEVPHEWRYVYLEIEDANGRRAWTNPLYVERRSNHRDGGVSA